MSYSGICAAGLEALSSTSLNPVVDESLNVIFEDPCDLNSELCKLINRYAYQGTCDFRRGYYYEYHIPTLKIDGKDMGTLDNLKIQDIKALAEPSPFGLGSKTVYDENVRKASEIKGSRIELPFTVPEEVHAMAPAGYRVSAKLYKLAIYEKDGFFAEHADTLHREDHIGTLVVCLPVPHEGGSFILSDDGNELRLPFDEMIKDKNMPWVSFYTDVKHQVEVVKSGMRMTLQFDLYIESRSSLMFNEQCDPAVKVYKFQDYNQEILQVVQEKIERRLQAVEEWEDPIGIAILMRRRYGVVSLSPDTLKGIDSMLYNALKDDFRVELKHVIIEQGSDYKGYGEKINVVALSKISEVEEQSSEEEEKKDEVDVNKKHVPKKYSGRKANTESLKDDSEDSREKTVYLVTGSLPKTISKLVCQQYESFTGNEAQPALYSYMNAALFVYLKPETDEDIY